MNSAVALLAVAVAAALLAPASALTSPQCLNMDGKAVDWWVILKMPYDKSSSNVNVSRGYAYAYSDSVTPLALVKGSLDDQTTGALYYTLQQIYNNHNSPDELAWFYYNDEDPTDHTHNSYGHNKGVATFDSVKGYWLIHSTPRWPNGSSFTYEYPDEEKTYGQSFLCVNYDIDTFNSVGSQWLLNKPYMYDQNLPASFASTVPNIVDVMNHKFITTTPASQFLALESVKGQPISSFAKNGVWGQDLYESLIAPTLKSNLQAETWMNGINPTPSYCTFNTSYSYDVRDVRNVTVDGVYYTETKDHSKWCVTYSQESCATPRPVAATTAQYVCIGDINRQDSQQNRGGGSACIQYPQLWKDFTSIISGSDSCC